MPNYPAPQTKWRKNTRGAANLRPEGNCSSLFFFEQRLGPLAFPAGHRVNLNPDGARPALAQSLPEGISGQLNLSIPRPTMWHHSPIQSRLVSFRQILTVTCEATDREGHRMSARILNKSERLRQESDQLINKAQMLKDQAKEQITRALQIIAKLKSG
jgi:hypothetical protein